MTSAKAPHTHALRPRPRPQTAPRLSKSICKAGKAGKAGKVGQSGVIYMIQTPRDQCKRTPVWKVGYTCQAFGARLRQYPKGTVVVATFNVRDARKVERKVMRSFRRTYTLDRGAEYFIGDREAMLRHLHRLVYWDCL